MESILLSANVMFPLFIMMVLGYWLRKCGRLNDETVTKMNGITFHVFISSMVFDSIYNAELLGIEHLSFAVYGVACVLLLFFCSWFLIAKLEPVVIRRGVMVQGLYRSNLAILGITICRSIFGEGKIGATVILIAIVVPLYNCLAVIILSIYRGEKVGFIDTVKDVLKNPVIVATILGVILKLLNIQLPRMVLIAVGDLSDLATPIALILLGGYFRFNSSRKYAFRIMLVSVFKLIIIPLIFITLSVFLGYRGVELASLMIMFGAPVGVSTFTMSQEMGGDSELACQIIVFSSLFSMLTLFIWIAALNSLALI